MESFIESLPGEPRRHGFLRLASNLEAQAVLSAYAISDIQMICQAGPSNTVTSKSVSVDITADQSIPNLRYTSLSPTQSNSVGFFWQQAVQ